MNDVKADVSLNHLAFTEEQQHNLITPSLLLFFVSCRE